MTLSGVIGASVGPSRDDNQANRFDSDHYFLLCSTFMRLNLNQLRVFEAVARTGSFTRAAEELSVTQPAVTVQIRHLEHECGIALFDRVRRRARLTQAGQGLFAYAQRMFALADEASRLLDLMRGLGAGRLRLISGRTAAAYYLPTLIGSFRQAYPAIELQLLVDTSQRVAEGLLAFRDDIGVLADEPRHPDLVREPLCDDRLVLVVPPRHPWTRRRRVSLREVADVPFIHREPGSTTRALVERRMSELGVKLNVTMELGSNEAITRSVEMGNGVSLLSAAVVASEVESRSVAVVRTAEAQVARHFDLAYHRDRRDAPLVDALLGVARKVRARRRTRPPA